MVCGSVGRTCFYTVGFARRFGLLYHPGNTYNIWKVRIVPRIPADIRISLKKRGGQTYRIELVRQSVGRRYGKYSTKVPERAATEIAEPICHWLVANS